MQTFNNVSTDVWTCLKASLAQHQININADSGSAEAHGIYASWNYDAAAKTLQVQVTRITNFFVTCSMANQYLHDAVDKCYANHGLAATKMIE
jgi:hypothetical protein